jgi:hypothetical protein
MRPFAWKQPGNDDMIDPTMRKNEEKAFEENLTAE